jgi:hypothetical protein
MARAPAETVRPDARNMIRPVCPITVKSSLEQLSGVCGSCKTLLRPPPGDCCVFCPFGTVTVVRGLT